MIDKLTAKKNSYKFWQKHNSEKGFPELYPEEEVVRFLSGFKKKKKINILDLASGSGKNTFAAINKGYNVYCVDYSKPGLDVTLKNIKKKKLCKTFCIDITSDKLPFSNNFFDGIIATQVLDHIFKDDVTFVLSGMKRVLKKNGKILLNLMSNKTSKKSRLGLKIKNEKNTYLTNYGNSAGEIHSLFSEKEMKKLFINKFKIYNSMLVNTSNDFTKEKTVFKYFYLTH
jgi:ubiquinone/menaquinone biosynthesis C-methylase UbiE